MVELNQAVSATQRSNHDVIEAGFNLPGELDACPSTSCPNTKRELKAKPVWSAEIDRGAFSSEQSERLAPPTGRFN